MVHTNFQGNSDEFRERVWEYYRHYGRDFAWRRTYDPYEIVVSEIMLQQTQVSRIEKRFPEFLSRFPTFEALAQAPLRDVLEAWQGIGYNRRAKYLQRIAEVVTYDYNGQLPQTPDQLNKLPGIGEATSGSIAAFAFQYPAVFIETNIRRAYLYWFFPEEENVSDRDLYPLVADTIDTEHPREWYYALQDYGNMLAAYVGNPNRRSKHYHKQSPFEGSNRQVRSFILQILLEHGPLTEEQITHTFSYPESRIPDNLRTMTGEGIIRFNADETYSVEE